MARHIDDTRHWRARAEEAHRLANQMADPGSKQLMLGIAVSYLQLAASAAERAAARQLERDYRK